MNTYSSSVSTALGNPYPGMTDHRNLPSEETILKDQDTLVQRLRIGVRIRRERLLWGLTQEQLSSILGISTNYLGQIERGNRGLSRKMADKLCAFFRLDRSELYSPDISTEQVSEDNFLFPNLNQMEIIRLLSSCTPEELALCGQMLRYLLLCLRKPEASEEDMEQHLQHLQIPIVR